MTCIFTLYFASADVNASPTGGWIHFLCLLQTDLQRFDSSLTRFDENKNWMGVSHIQNRTYFSRISKLDIKVRFILFQVCSLLLFHHEKIYHQLHHSHSLRLPFSPQTLSILICYSSLNLLSFRCSAVSI